MTKKKHPATSSTRPLLKALDQNDSVKETVKQSADELLVINAVLKKGIPEQAQTGDLAQALEKTEVIEDTIQESAKDLAEVNKLLEHEVDERIELERELLATKTALARAKSELKED
ncbi:MAG: hypothetical protein H7228_04355 [Polaromonas sp.]|nr:hypothetical protein [Polaromonas sp.]